jgi:hypothetical protein
MRLKGGLKNKKKRTKTLSWSKLVKELDRVFSIYIRQRAANFSGYITCVCCGKQTLWQEAQNMHYNSRSRFNTRWDVRNTYPGDYSCNIAKNGNYPAFTKYLLNTYGSEWLTQLIKDGEKLRKFTPQELRELIEKYKNLIKSL